MSSPSIDLNMNLLSSPVPPARSGRNDGDGRGKISQIQMAASSDTDNGLVGMDDLGSFPLDGGNDDNFRPAISMTSMDQSKPGNTNKANESVERRLSNDRMVANGKPRHNYEATIQMVESWREEIYMMNVQNSILLDDLVRSGADA